MNELYLKIVLQEFDLRKCNTTFGEINTEIDYIKKTFVYEYKDLFVCLAFKN